MADVTGQEVHDFAARREHRRKVLGALKSVVERKGSRVVKVDKGWEEVGDE